jgi:Core-2/I-Branching enzyme
LRAFHALMDAIYHPHHIYILHIDVKSDEDLIHYILHEYCQSLSNCFYIYPRNVAWAGMTTGEMMLALMQESLECPTHVATGCRVWDYFILIGHESVSLTS